MDDKTLMAKTVNNEEIIIFLHKSKNMVMILPQNYYVI